MIDRRRQWYEEAVGSIHVAVLLIRRTAGQTNRRYCSLSTLINIGYTARASICCAGTDETDGRRRSTVLRAL